jgi:hypothetical protein
MEVKSQVYMAAKLQVIDYLLKIMWFPRTILRCQILIGGIKEIV